ncbi:MAG: GNAT family N-acetyltransferase, partial [Anaerolineae bacterium]|nr:GNAT family N-acetyltransferase [Anaerolineae bacterium]
NEAFSEHWGMGPTTPERVAEMVGEPGFEPADVLLATWQREVVGLCHMRFLERQVHGRSLAVAHIGPVAVLTGHRGRGLGHALVAACLHQCRRKHMQAAELDVDEGNRPAIHVYEDCGFETLFRILWYRRDLDGEDCG